MLPFSQSLLRIWARTRKPQRYLLPKITYGRPVKQLGSMATQPLLAEAKRFKISTLCMASKVQKPPRRPRLPQ
jgi:hypothetical protein